MMYIGDLKRGDKVRVIDLSGYNLNCPEYQFEIPSRMVDLVSNKIVEVNSIAMNPKRVYITIEGVDDWGNWVLPFDTIAYIVDDKFNKGVWLK